MTTARLIFALFATAAIGFGASRFQDRSTIDTLISERDLARDCRQSGSSLPPCPVVYRNTKIVWRKAIEKVPTADLKQARELAQLSDELASARQRIRDLQTANRALDRLRYGAMRRVAGAGYAVQNGSVKHPYASWTRCPPGSVAVYEASVSGGNAGSRFSGDPNVCYVRMRLRSNDGSY